MRLLASHGIVDSGILKHWINTVHRRFSKWLGHFLYVGVGGQGVGRPHFVHLREGLLKFACGIAIVMN